MFIGIAPIGINGPSQLFEPQAPAGYMFLVDNTGAYLVDNENNYLMEAV